MTSPLAMYVNFNLSGFTSTWYYFIWFWEGGMGIWHGGEELDECEIIPHCIFCSLWKYDLQFKTIHIKVHHLVIWYTYTYEIFITIKVIIIFIITLRFSFPSFLLFTFNIVFIFYFLFLLKYNWSIILL